MLIIQSEWLFQETSVRARASHVELFLTNDKIIKNVFKFIYRVPNY
jgi:hypothetical protein